MKNIYFIFPERAFISFLIQKQMETSTCCISFEEAKLYLEYSDITKLENLGYRLSSNIFPKQRSKKKIMISLFDLFSVNEEDKCIYIIFNEDAFPLRQRHFEISLEIREENNRLKEKYRNRFIVFEKNNNIYIYSNLLEKCFYSWGNYEQYQNGNEDLLNINSVLMGFLFSWDESGEALDKKYFKELEKFKNESFEKFLEWEDKDEAFEKFLEWEDKEYESWETKIESLMNSNDRKIFEINRMEKLSKEEKAKILEELKN